MGRGAASHTRWTIAGVTLAMCAAFLHLEACSCTTLEPAASLQSTEQTSRPEQAFELAAPPDESSSSRDPLQLDLSGAFEGSSAPRIRHVSGELRIPTAWKIADPDLLVRSPGWNDPITDMEDSNDLHRSLEPLGERDGYLCFRWRFEQLAAAPAVVWIASPPFGVPIDASASDVEGVLVDVPPPGRLEVDLVDGETGAHAPVHGVSFLARRIDGTPSPFGRGLEFDYKAHVHAGPCPVGDGYVRVFAAGSPFADATVPVRVALELTRARVELARLPVLELVVRGPLGEQVPIDAIGMVLHDAHGRSAFLDGVFPHPGCDAAYKLPRTGAYELAFERVPAGFNRPAPLSLSFAKTEIQRQTIRLARTE